MSSPHPIYQYFTEHNEIEGGKSARKYRCNFQGCFSSILWKGSPSNLSNHLKQHSQLAPYQDDEEDTHLAVTLKFRLL
jgi:hypothetical protein